MLKNQEKRYRFALKTEKNVTKVLKKLKNNVTI